MSNVLVFVLELIGTAAFAVSGAIVGIKKQMDLFGVIVLGVCTAVGGGIVRDVILGITPPATFHDPVYTLSAAAVSVLMFLPHVRARVGRHEPVFDRLLLVMDAVGLGVFTVVGVQCAYRQAEHDTLFLTVFVGLITGVGGGVLRDVFSGERPYIFVRHFYACASIIGALICALCWDRLGANAAMLFGAAAIVVLRLLAAYYHWSLPKSDYHDEPQTTTAAQTNQDSEIHNEPEEIEFHSDHQRNGRSDRSGGDHRGGGLLFPVPEPHLRQQHFRPRHRTVQLHPPSPVGHHDDPEHRPSDHRLSHLRKGIRGENRLYECDAARIFRTF